MDRCINKDTYFLGVKLYFASKTDILLRFNKSVKFSKKGYISLINANIVAESSRNKVYREVINNSTFNIPDGSIIVSLFNLINHTNFKAYPGPEFFLDIIKLKEYKSFFLGSTTEVLSKLKKEILVYDNSISDAVFHPLPFFNNISEFDYIKIAEKINKVKPDIIWISLGAPKQELFISKLYEYLDHGIMVGIGQAFPISARVIKAPPKIIRNFKLEWLFRVFVEPSKTIRRLKKEFYYVPKLFLKELRNANNNH